MSLNLTNRRIDTDHGNGALAAVASPQIDGSFLKPAPRGPLRYGLIGAGGFGQTHLGTLHALEKEGRLQIRAVADPNFGLLPETETALKGQDIACHLDYREMLRLHDDIDVAVVIAPIPYHLEVTRACLARGLHVYLEKPPVPVLQQLAPLIAWDVHSRVGVGFQMIGATWSRMLKEALCQGKIGRLQEIRIAAGWPRTAGYYTRAPWVGKMSLGESPIFDGPATNALCHLIQNAMYFASDDPEGFACPVEVQGELYRSRPIESYDTASLRGRFASGVTFTAALTHATEILFPFQLEVRGSAGWARVIGDGTRTESSYGTFAHEEHHTAVLQRSHDRFLDFVEGRQARPLVRLEDTRGYLLTAAGLLLSSGWIHDIDPRRVRSYGAGPDEGRNVEGLFRALQATLDTGLLFSEQGLPWAAPSRPVPVGSLKGIAWDIEKKESWTVS